MRFLKNIGQCLAAGGLLALAVQSAQAEDYGISYTWIEGGVTRIATDAHPKSLNMDGGYIRGSFSLGDNFYLLGSYSQNSGKWKDTSIDGPHPYRVRIGLIDRVTEVTTTDKIGYKEKLAQAELGLGFRLGLAERMDFVAELMVLNWEQNRKQRLNGHIHTEEYYTWRGSVQPISPRTVNDYYYDGPKDSQKDRVWGGKALAGIRFQPFNMLDLWAKAGYVRMENDFYTAGEKNYSVLGNFGAHLRVTENFGLVGEADIFRENANQYRVGARLSF